MIIDDGIKCTYALHLHVDAIGADEPDKLEPDLRENFKLNFESVDRNYNLHLISFLNLIWGFN